MSWRRRVAKRVRRVHALHCVLCFFIGARQWKRVQGLLKPKEKRIKGEGEFGTYNLEKRLFFFFFGGILNTKTKLKVRRSSIERFLKFGYCTTFKTLKIHIEFLKYNLQEVLFQKPKRSLQCNLISWLGGRWGIEQKFHFRGKELLRWGKVSISTSDSVNEKKEQGTVQSLVRTLCTPRTH